MAFNSSTARYLSDIANRELDRNTELDEDVCKGIRNAIMDGKRYLQISLNFHSKGYGIKIAEKTEILLEELGYNIIDISYVEDDIHGIIYRHVDIEISW